MKCISIIAILLLFSRLTIAQESSNDSIQLAHIQTLKNVSKNINKLANEIANIDSIQLPVKNEATLRDDSIIAIVDSNSLQNLKDKKSFGDLLYKSFGNLFSAIIGGLIALFVFYRRWQKDVEKDDLEEARIVQERNDYMKSVLKAVIDLSNKYRAAIDEFNSKLTANNYDLPNITLYPLQEFGRLQKIVDNELYFHAYTKKYGNTEETLDNYRTIASLADYLNSQMAELFKKDYLIRDHERKVKYIQMFQEILEESSAYGESCEHTNPKIYHDIGKLLGDYMPLRTKENTTRITIHHENFITPLRALILSKYYTVPELKMILNKIARIVHLYNEIPFQNVSILEEFNAFYKTMSEVLDRLRLESKRILEGA